MAPLQPVPDPPGSEVPDTSLARVPMRLLAVSTDTVRPAGTLSVEGDGFSSVASAYSITLGGVRVAVRAASASRLELLLPPAEAFPCLPTAPATLRISLQRAGQHDVVERSVMLAVARRVALRAGASVNLLESGAARCTELVAPADESARYTLAVLNTQRGTAQSAGFQLRAEAVGAVSPAVAGMASPLNNRSVSSPAAVVRGSVSTARALFDRGQPGGDMTALPSVAHSDHDHSRQLDRQRALVAATGVVQRTTVGAVQQTAAETRAVAAGLAAVSLPPLAVGQLVQRNAMYGSCGLGAQVTARVVYAGTRALVLEDVASPTAGTMDHHYRALGEEFDAVQYPLLLANFGDPLAMNGALGGDGRVTMLFSPYVNQTAPGVSGYVSACNLYPRTQIASSNEDELFYARVPRPDEAPANWLRGMRSTVMHEGKHLAAFAERLARDLPLEEAWLEEATARIAEELYARTFSAGSAHGAAAWKGNTGWAESVECELYQCDGRPLMMWKHFPALHDYLAGADTLSPLGRTGAQDVTWYASGWSLVRWAVDHFATDEARFLRDLVLGSEGGMAALEARTGLSAESLLADWALAHAVDDRPGFVPEQSTLSFPSWNVPQIMAGLAEFIGPRYSAQPLRVHDISGNAQVQVPQLRGFAARYLETVVASGASQVVELRDANGGAMPASIRLAIVRVQ